MKYRRTYKAKCLWCPDSVFHCTRGHDDFVLLDELGPPWIIHSCWVKHCNSKKAREAALKKAAMEKNQTNPTVTLPSGVKKKLSSFRKAYNSIVNKNLIPTQENIANYLELSSIEDLYKLYGDVYECYRENGVNRVRMKSF
jgi:hypothetical protein